VVATRRYSSGLQTSLSLTHIQEKKISPLLSATQAPDFSGFSLPFPDPTHSLFKLSIKRFLLEVKRIKLLLCVPPRGRRSPRQRGSPGRKMAAGAGRPAPSPRGTRGSQRLSTAARHSANGRHLRRFCCLFFFFPPKKIPYFYAVAEVSGLQSQIPFFT